MNITMEEYQEKLALLAQIIERKDFLKRKINRLNNHSQSLSDHIKQLQRDMVTTQIDIQLKEDMIKNLESDKRIGEGPIKKQRQELANLHQDMSRLHQQLQTDENTLSDIQYVKIPSLVKELKEIEPDVAKYVYYKKLMGMLNTNEIVFENFKKFDHLRNILSDITMCDVDFMYDISSENELSLQKIVFHRNDASFSISANRLTYKENGSHVNSEKDYLEFSAKNPKASELFTQIASPDEFTSFHANNKRLVERWYVGSMAGKTYYIKIDNKSLAFHEFFGIHLADLPRGLPKITIGVEDHE